MAPRTSAPGCDHGAWPDEFLPLRRDADGTRRCRRRQQPTDYAFVRVEGDGVHEIPVGPVHAGIIEPGHFRFSVVGEKVLRLEQRLGYVHKGIDERFTELAPLQAHRLAGRVSGDSTVAYAWAYCMAPDRSPAARFRRAPPGCARCCSSASAWPTTSATWARWATMPRSPSGWRSSRACARLAAPVQARSSATG